MFALLAVIKGSDDGKTFRLADGETKVVGRGSQSGIILNDPGISRKHCSISLEGNALLARDLGSRNGTFVNGRKIDQEVRLADGDLLIMGEACLRVQVRTRIEVAQPQREEKAAQLGGMETLPPRGNFEPMPPERPSVEVADDVRTVQQASPVTVNAPGLMLQDELDMLTGCVLGGCRIGKRVGEDESALIFRAVQVSMEREVLLKILRPKLATDRKGVDRFLTAARAGGRLSHPNVVQVYDAGEERGFYFIAIEFAGDETVKRRIEQGSGKPLSLRHAVEVAEQVAGALDYAHSQQVLHRAVTPANIVLMEHGIAKLANLGFARGLGESLSGGLAGNDSLCAYAAPELLDDPLAESPRSDIYSLGGVLYFMVTGRSPAPCVAGQAANGVRAGRNLSARQVRREISEELAKIIDRAMAANLADRYGRASELQNALQYERERLRR